MTKVLVRCEFRYRTSTLHLDYPDPHPNSCVVLLFQVIIGYLSNLEIEPIARAKRTSVVVVPDLVPDLVWGEERVIAVG